MGWLDIFKKNSEFEQMFDLDLIADDYKKTYLKRLAIETCIGMIGRTISQSEFRVKNDKKFVKDEMYYRLNVRPNINMSAAEFWQTVIYKLIYDNECLIVQDDTGDLLIADSFQRVEYAVYEDIFQGVIVKDYQFKRNFQMNDVIYVKYSNQKLSRLIDELFSDYGALFGRLLEFQNTKNQIRATVDVEAMTGKDQKQREKLQNFINKLYKAFKEKAIAIVPQQKGYKYEEQQKNQTTSNSVEEINKATDGFLYQLAYALGIPISLLKGDMADVEKQTRNFMLFCIDPILKKIADELNAKLFVKKDFLAGKKIDIKRITYSNIFDLANAVDKLRASGVMNGNELRDELGQERVDDPIMDEYYITKNYQPVSDSLKGGEEK